MNKRIKKMLLIFSAMLMLFFGIVPKQEKNQVDADAGVLSGPALYYLGATLIAAVSGVVLSQPATQELGKNLVNNIKAKGKDIKDFIIHNGVSNELLINPNVDLTDAMADTLHAEKTLVNVGTISRSVISLDGNRNLGAFPAKEGSVISVKAHVSTVGEYSAHFYLSGYSPSRGWYRLSDTITVSKDKPVTIDMEYQLDRDITEIGIGSQYGSGVVVSNLEIVNLGYVGDGTITQERKDQMKEVPGLLTDIKKLLDERFTEEQYIIDMTQPITHTTTFEDLTATEEITEKVSQSNNFLKRIISALGSLPNAIALSMATILLGGFPTVKDMLQNLWGSTKEKIKDMSADLSALTDGMLIFLGDGAYSFKDQMLLYDDMLANVPDMVATGILTGISSLRDILTGIDEGVRDLSGTIIDGVVSGVDSAAGSLSNVGISIKTALQSMAQSLGVALSDILSAIRAMGISLTDVLTGVLTQIKAIPMAIYDLFIPDISAIKTVQDSVSDFADNFKAEYPDLYTDGKFKALFSNPRSIYDLEITYKDETNKLVPLYLKPHIDKSRNFNTGALVLFMATSVYKRYKGRGQLFK